MVTVMSVRTDMTVLSGGGKAAKMIATISVSSAACVCLFYFQVAFSKRTEPPLTCCVLFLVPSCTQAKHSQEGAVDAKLESYEQVAFSVPIHPPPEAPGAGRGVRDEATSFLLNIPSSTCLCSLPLPVLVRRRKQGQRQSVKETMRGALAHQHCGVDNTGTTLAIEHMRIEGVHALRLRARLCVYVCDVCEWRARRGGASLEQFTNSYMYLIGLSCCLCCAYM